MVNLNDLILFTKQKLADEGYSYWKVGTFNSKRVLGRACFNKQEIQFSRYFMERISWEEAVDTALHEIAHVIAGIEEGHGIKWQRIASRLGARPNATVSTGIEHEYAYVMVDTTRNNKIVKGYFKKPTATIKKVHTLYLENRPDETLGKLKIMQVVRK